MQKAAPWLSILPMAISTNAVPLPQAFLFQQPFFSLLSILPPTPGMAASVITLSDNTQHIPYAYHSICNQPLPYLLSN